MKTLTVEELIAIEKECILIDLRSPKEFNQGTINCAINLPILDDEERAIIGTIYKQDSQEKAKIEGIKHVSAKLDRLVDEVNRQSKKGMKVVLFCSRGGYRSGPLVQLLNSIGIITHQLIGGYKAYRNYVLHYFEDRIASDHKFIVLHGLTGCGKTAILKELMNHGYPAINLEGLARNSGSVFGFIGHTSEEITQKQFESILMHQLLEYTSQPIFIESESMRIGRVNIPKKMHEQMELGIHVLIQTTIDHRVKQVVGDYISSSKTNDDQLHKAIKHLVKYLGKEKVTAMEILLEQKNHEKIAKDLMIHYYDPLYKHSIKKYSYDLEITYDTINEAVHLLSQFHDHIQTA